MKAKKVKILVSVPAPLLKKVNELARKAKLDRSAFICANLDSKFFSDEMRKANP
jgi:metal-responsive CopG/Arc/MetJ family transcriptional regulator